MHSRVVNGVEVTTSTGNVFADLGLPDAEQLKIKAGRVVEDSDVKGNGHDDAEA